jgi:RHS repeat-associated protein
MTLTANLAKHPKEQSVRVFRLFRGSPTPDIVTNVVGSLLLAKHPEAFTYDSDGNLTSDSLWTNVWNGENRRMTIESRSTLPAAAKVKEQWTHLADGRWIERIVSTNNGTSYYPSLTNRYVWDGQVLLAVLDHTNGVVVSFLRGLDLSGSLQGAGGVGGVLAVKAGSSAQCGPMANTTHFTYYDGNGNVTALVNATDGSESARYERAPFAERLRETGPMAKLNPIRFSTQYHDDYTDDDKYLYRDLREGRWPNRDPIGERGGVNLYGFVGNSPLNKVDHLGLDAAIINHGGYTGHTSFVIINPDGSVKAYHFYAKSHQTGRCCGLGSLLSVCCDKVSVWSETSGSLTNYLQSQGGDVKIVAYALGTPLDDQLSLEDLDEQDKADAGIYSLAAGIECHKKSWDWFNEYKEFGPEIYPTLLPGQPWPPYWPERWFETRRHRQQSFPQVPAPPTPAPAP